MLKSVLQYRLVVVAIAMSAHGLTPAAPGLAQKTIPQTPFSFDAIISLDEMRQFIIKEFPQGSSMDSLRNTFVEMGKATLKPHPTWSGVEKYIYDVNLCGYYVWRWNISADYDAGGRLLEAYVNADPVFNEHKPKIPEGKKAKIYKSARPRPEADKGESSLAYLLYDGDGNLATPDDQMVIGAGPSRADPVKPGKMTVYNGVEPWRSIFDDDEAAQIASFPGDCSKASELLERKRHP